MPLKVVKAVEKTTPKAIKFDEFKVNRLLMAQVLGGASEKEKRRTRPRSKEDSEALIMVAVKRAHKFKDDYITFEVRAEDIP